jgi:hypothetical protein
MSAIASPLYNVGARAILASLEAAPHGDQVKADVFRLNFLAIVILAFVIWLSSHASRCAAQATEDALVVRTASGQLREVAKSGGGAEFLGIPYSQPPVGDLRWHEPSPAKPWTGIRDTTSFGAPCAQPVTGAWNRHDAERGAEDRLYLNVVTPVWPARSPLPVILWLHGGANEGGTASTVFYNNGPLVNHGVLLVTVQLARRTVRSAPEDHDRTPEAAEVDGADSRHPFHSREWQLELHCAESIFR